MEQGARDQSQIGLLMTQVANLKVAIAVQEAERTAVDVARDRPSRVIGVSKLSVKAFVPLSQVSSFLPALGLSLMAVFDCGSTACFRFAHEGVLRFGGKDGHEAKGDGGDHGADSVDQFCSGHVLCHAWCWPRDCPAGTSSR